MAQVYKCSASVIGSKNTHDKKCGNLATIVSMYNDPGMLPPAWQHAQINTSLCADHEWLAKEEYLAIEPLYLLGSSRAHTGWGMVVNWIFPVEDEKAGRSGLGNIASHSRDYAVLVDGTGRIVASTVACGNNSCYCQVWTATFAPPNIFYQRAIRQVMAKEREVVQ